MDTKRRIIVQIGQLYETEFNRMTSQALTPKQLADAIGVSESSLKRWADEGVIRSTRTAGGHRRIPVAEAIRFVRESGSTLVNPSILGLPDIESVVDRMPARAEMPQRLASYLTAGSAREARGLIMACYMSGVSLAELFDTIVAPAMHQIGELWRHDPHGVFIEHRATDLCLQSINQLRAMQTVNVSAPAAVGAAPSRDPYLIPSMMSAAVLTAEGMNAVNLGPNTPASSLVQAAHLHHAALVWLSLSASEDIELINPYVAELLEGLQNTHARIVIGGRSRSLVTAVEADRMIIVGLMSDLATFARGVMKATLPAHGR